MILELLLLTALPQKAPAEPGIVRYQVIPEASSAGFDGSSTLHDFGGQTSAVTGELRVDLARIAETAGGIFRVEAKTLDTDNDGRDEGMREHLDVENHPYITFDIDSVRGVLKGRRGTLEGTGRFTIKGVSRQRTFPLSVDPVGDNGLHFKARATFDITDHGIAAPSKLVVSMDEEITVWVDLQMRPVDGKPIEASRRVLQVTERLEVPGQAPLEVKSVESLWSAPRGLFWERPQKAEWILASAGKVTTLDLRRGERSDQVRNSEDAFDESRQRLESLEAKLEGLSAASRKRLGKRIEDSIARLGESLKNAPAGGDADVVREGERISIRLGGVEWALIEGLEGTGKLSVFQGIPDLPREVRAELAQLEGLPTSLKLRTAGQAGVRTFEIQFGAEESGRVPDWAWTPETWTKAAQTTEEPK